MATIILPTENGFKSKSYLPSNDKSLTTILSWANQERAKYGMPLWDEKVELRLPGETFSDAIHRITGYYPCPLCHGPQVLDRFGKLVCAFYPAHSVVLRTRCIHDPHADYPEQCPDCMKHIILMLGPRCGHGLYMAECGQCIRESFEINSQKGRIQ